MPLLMTNGVKNLKMDSVAHHLGISKRTLYEIFSSKEELVLEIIKHLHNTHHRYIQDTIKKSQNAMEMLILALRCHIRIMADINASFLYDLDGDYPKIKKLFEFGVRKAYIQMLQTFELGVSQGVFVPTVDYRIVLRLFLIQMESLKRMEDNFPSDVTMSQTVNTIAECMLRSIATQKGLSILESYLEENEAESAAHTCGVRKKEK